MTTKLSFGEALVRIDNELIWIRETLKANKKIRLDMPDEIRVDWEDALDKTDRELVLSIEELEEWRGKLMICLGIQSALNRPEGS